MADDTPIIAISGTAPVNIAVIKYWGKRDEQLILPVNGSLSGTLDQADLKTHTTVYASRKFSKHRMWLNGKEQDIESGSESAVRVRRCIKALMASAAPEVEHVDLEGRRLKVHATEWSSYHFHIVSVNNFPTAAGLASSASGYACLVFVFGQLFGTDHDISQYARQGSGSACRSMFGGFVRWNQGERADGSDSTAVQVVPEDYWPSMRVMVLVVSDHAKDTGSTAGMQLTVETSALMKYRASNVVPERLIGMEKAIRGRDFCSFADITMQDSNQFHAVCLDTFPPIFYLNDISRAIIRAIHAYNTTSGRVKVAYTFDAGPNACLYLEEESLAEVAMLFLYLFPPKHLSPKSFIKDSSGLVSKLGLTDETNAQTLSLPAHLATAFNKFSQQPDALKYMISTKIGPGPKVLDNDHLPVPVL
mmetsp:Transcript_9614/g.16420  ORF Transcript_9614/g.16420 Transcript_9614/m.16420 type:complete len:419 (-) Transcript_9614:1152-2408(-)